MFLQTRRVVLFLGSIEDVAEVFEACAEVVPPAREALGFAVVALAGAELGQVGDELGVFGQEWDGFAGVVNRSIVNGSLKEAVVLGREGTISLRWK